MTNQGKEVHTALNLLAHSKILLYVPLISDIYFKLQDFILNVQLGWFFATFCLVLFIILAIFISRTSCAIAQELYPKSDQVGDGISCM